MGSLKLRDDSITRRDTIKIFDPIIVIATVLEGTGRKGFPQKSDEAMKKGPPQELDLIHSD